MTKIIAVHFRIQFLINTISNNTFDHEKNAYFFELWGIVMPKQL